VRTRHHETEETRAGMSQLTARVSQQQTIQAALLCCAINFRRMSLQITDDQDWASCLQPTADAQSFPKIARYKQPVPTPLRSKIGDG